ncbi:hypothetical protein BH10PSE9_BH10PSE9_23080 [soil metagenome]
MKHEASMSLAAIVLVAVGFGSASAAGPKIIAGAGNTTPLIE